MIQPFPHIVGEGAAVGDIDRNVGPTVVGAADASVVGINVGYTVGSRVGVKVGSVVVRGAIVFSWGKSDGMPDVGCGDTG